MRTRPAGVTSLSAPVLDEALSGQVDFQRHAAPILQAKCLHCHQPSAMPGHLSSVSREAAFASGPYIIPGQPNASPLIRTLGGKAHLAMPAVGNQVSSGRNPRPQALDPARGQLARRHSGTLAALTAFLKHPLCASGRSASRISFITTDRPQQKPATPAPMKSPQIIPNRKRIVPDSPHPPP